jgi:uncharacterized protein YidB (DUF937 family)
MNRGLPSLTALLGLLAIAGYQNRDKIAELIREAQTKYATPSAGGSQGSREGILGNLLGGTSLGELLGGGLRDLVESFKSSGQGDIADSWVRNGPSKAVSTEELERAISPEVLGTLSEQTGLSRQELLSRLARELPEAVDRYTPEGRLPPNLIRIARCQITLHANSGRVQPPLRRGVRLLSGARDTPFLPRPGANG